MECDKLLSNNAENPNPIIVIKITSDKRIPRETMAPEINPLFRLVSVIAKNTGPKEIVNGSAEITPRKKNFINTYFS